MKARVRWEGEARFSVELETGTKLVIDSTSEKGPSPMEAVLGGLAACDAFIVLQLLSVMRQKPDEIEVEAFGTKGKETPQKFEDIRLKYSIHGKALRRESIKRAIALSESRYCPVVVMLREGGVRISSSYTLG